GQRDGDGADGRPEGSPEHERGRDREEHGHRQILDDKQVQDRGGLPVAEAVEVGEDLGDDPRRGRPRHTAEEHRCGTSPAERDARREAGREVGDGIHDSRRRAGAQTVSKLVSRVLESQRQEKQEHADLGDLGNEVVTDFQREHPAFTNRETGDQVQRDGREAEPSCDPRQDGERERNRADLDEPGRDVRVRCAQDHASNIRRLSSPSGVPTATTTSPSWRCSSGPGAGTVASPRTTATIDAPVLVRYAPSAIVLPAPPPATVTQSIATPSSRCTRRTVSLTWLAPSTSVRAAASSTLRCRTVRHTSRSVRS